MGCFVYILAVLLTVAKQVEGRHCPLLAEFSVLSTHRQSYLKMKFTRPSPIVRKRRPYGKARPPLATSEGDMAQADEMGEEDRVSDDGFVDGTESFRRKTKRRQSEFHLKVIITQACS